MSENTSLAHEFFLRARSMDMEGKVAVALGYYQTAFRYDSASRDLCFLLLDRMRESGKSDSAISLGKACLELEGEPTSAEYQSVGQAYLFKGDINGALDCYREAVRLDEDDRDALYILTGLYEKNGDVPHYAGTLVRLLPRLEYPPRLVNQLMLAYRRLGCVDSIIPVLRAAWQRTGQAGFGEELAAYYHASSQRDKFLEVAEELARTYPQNAAYQYAFGSAALEAHMSGSYAALEKAVSLAPSVPDYWARLIFADLVFKRDSLAAFRLAHLPDSAREEWQNAFIHGLVRVLVARQLESRTSEIDSSSRKDSLSAQSHRRVAADLFRKALVLNPGNRLVLFELGADLERLGRRDSAEKALRQSVKDDTLNAVAMNYLGYMLVEDSADLDFAGKLIDRALALDPESGAYLDSKGWWHYRKGEFAAAKAELQKAAARMPNDPTIMEHLAVVLDLLGEKEAVRSLRRKLLPAEVKGK